MGVLGVLGDIAIFAQLCGLHVSMLVALAARLLRIPQCETECAKLQESDRRLRALLLWCPGGNGAVLDAAGEALAGASGLVSSYRRTTLWRRVRTGRSMEARLQDARDGVDCVFALLLCAHGNNLLATVHPVPTSDADAIHAYYISTSLSSSRLCHVSN